MGIQECEKLLLSRVRQVEPWNANGIVGYIISRNSYPQIRQYAFGPDEQIRSLILEAKSFMKSSAQEFPQLPSLQPTSTGRDFPLPYWKPQFQQSGSFHGIQAPVAPIGQIGAFQSPLPESIGLEEHLQSFRYPLNSSKSQTRPCSFYLSRGYCKKGVNCRFFHGSGVSEMHNERQSHPPGSLGKLEKEIRELLITRRPSPVPIAHLPMMYFEKYGKPLQAEGYLTESQRDGKAGCSLTSILLRLNTTRVIERQYGQHYIVLVEDAHKYVGYLADNCNLMDAGSGSNQIYLTFPVESTFTEEDVHNYFKRYGPVTNVRIPYQEKRMFGFVSFLYPETVRLLLSKGIPHFICGARILVKRYKEKPELTKFAEKNAPHFNYGAHRVSDVNVIHEHRTGEKLPSDHEFFREKLKNGCDLGIVTEKSSVTIAPEMASQLTHIPSFHSVKKADSPEGDNEAKLSHVSDGLDEALAYQDSDEICLPDSLGLY